MTVPIENEFAWSNDRDKLQGWFIGYLLTLSAALTWLVKTKFTADIGLLLLLGSLIPYIVSVVYAYRVQDALNKAKLYKPGAWQIIVGALLFNPFILGFVIPASVLWVTKRIEKKIREGKIDWSPQHSYSP